MVPLSLLTAIVFPVNFGTAQEAEAAKPETCTTCRENEKSKTSRFDELDADKDGKVTEAEMIKSHQKRVEEIAKKQFAAMDLDENGIITETEMKLVASRSGFRRNNRGMHSPHPRFHGSDAEASGHPGMNRPRQPFQKPHIAPRGRPEGVHPPMGHFRNGPGNFERGRHGGFGPQPVPHGTRDFRHPHPSGKPERGEQPHKGPQKPHGPPHPKAKPPKTPSEPKPNPEKPEADSTKSTESA